MMMKSHSDSVKKPDLWQQMVDRHHQERLWFLHDLASLRITQTEAARLMGMSVQNLNRLIKANGIFWPVKAQGRRQDDTK